VFDRLIDLFINFIEIFRCGTVIDEYERGVVLRFGRYHRILEPGFHFLWPFYIERVVQDSVVPRTWNLGPQGLTTLDGRLITVSAIITHSIKDIRKAMLEVERVDDAVRDLCYSNIARLIMQSTWADICSENFEDRLLRSCRRNAAKYGLDLTQVQLADCTPVRAYRLYGMEKA